jgi:alcohol dehydrogenase
MKAAYFIAPGKIILKEVAKPEIKQATDAVIKIVRACVCGSDMWWYRGINQRGSNTRVGHEAIGVVETVGSQVTKVKTGDFVVVPFTHGCGECAACLAGFDGNCENNHASEDSENGYQAEYLRYSNANWGLVKIPGKPQDYSESQLNDLLTLSDVMATGYHAAYTAEVKPGDAVAIIGDGAVGLCAVIAAKLMGAKQIIILSHHQERAELAVAFGATDIVSTRDNQAVLDVLTITNQAGVDAVLECVGNESSIQEAQQISRAGAIIGRVGVPQNEPSANKLFWSNIGLRGGIAAVTTHDEKHGLLTAVLNGDIHPGQVFTEAFHLDQIQAAYEAMDERRAIKSLIKITA